MRGPTPERVLDQASWEGSTDWRGAMGERGERLGIGIACERGRKRILRMSVRKRRTSVVMKNLIMVAGLGLSVSHPVDNGNAEQDIHIAELKLESQKIVNSTPVRW